ncbi:MAG: hypothetical protein J6X18_05840 [Bacteroidales bacterium]|nr:hypothetical protein [Bacteroidales bacterium]
MKLVWHICIITLLFCGCCSKEYCVGFDKRNAYFIPKIEEGVFWSMTPNDYEWSFYKTKISVTEPTQISSCDDCDCECDKIVSYTARFGNIYNVRQEQTDSYLTYDRNKKKDIIYILNSSNTNTNHITGQFIFENDTVSFSYTVNNDIIFTSNTILDSIVIDTITYYEVLELRGEKYTTIYLAKDKGFIQAISSDTVWTINENVKYTDLLYPKDI